MSLTNIVFSPRSRVLVEDTGSMPTVGTFVGPGVKLLGLRNR